MITVNSTTIAEDAILSEIQYHPADSQREAMIKASEALIIGELMKQRAFELGLEQSVGEQDMPDPEAHLQSLIDQEVELPQASEADCRHYFEQNQAKFTTSPLLSVRHILQSVAPDEDLARIEARRHAQSMIDALRADMGQFPTLAATHSRCHSAKEGGQLGQISKGQTVSEFERQLFNCDIGLVGAPIETRYGVHVVVIDRREDGKQLTFEMVHEKIAGYLNEKVRRKAIAQYIEQLISRADIDGFDFSVSESPLMQ
ncbi:MAG: peptidylprolyl isomerase [Alteromonadaceae bacterium]|nr:MAG: peptidylprolyl isomerase [Alteromonadaceae bacterium]